MIDLKSRESLQIVIDDKLPTKSIQKKMDKSIDLQEDNVYWDLERLSSISTLSTQADKFASLRLIGNKISKKIKTGFDTKHILLGFITAEKVEELTLKVDMNEYSILSAICEDNTSNHRNIHSLKSSAFTTRPLTFKERSVVLMSRKKDMLTGVWQYVGFSAVFLSLFIGITSLPRTTLDDGMKFSYSQMSGIYFTVQGLMVITMAMALTYIWLIKQTDIAKFMTENEKNAQC